MADVDTSQVVEENLTAGNENKTIPSTPEGMALAYGSLFLMAIVPICIGSFRSVTFHKEQKVIIHSQSHSVSLQFEFVWRNF